MKRRQTKTLMMMLIERDQGKSIEQLMVEAFRQHGTERGAADAIGITQQSFNVWKYRLGLADDIEAIRQLLMEQAL
jgi:hypothetical protein